MKRTRQRCQLARNTRAAAALIPSCGEGGPCPWWCHVGRPNEITSLTPAEAAAPELAQELDPEGLGLGGAHRHAEHLAPAVGVDRDGDGHCARDDSTASRTFT